MNYTLYKNSPVGDLIIYGKEGYLYGLEYFKQNFIKESWKEDKKEFKDTIDQLNLYFEGELKEFEIDLKIETSPFSKRVYEELQKIPYGTTISYEELAKRVGNPKASRAVGNANGKNPLAIIVPCHRVIAKNGKIGGYSGGMDKKRKLLKLEGIYLNG